MLNDNIRQFLQDLDARIPGEFESEIDDVLLLLAGGDAETAYAAVGVAQPVSNNVEYSRKDPRQKVSTSDNPPRTGGDTSEFPIHSRGDCNR